MIVPPRPRRSLRVLRVHLFLCCRSSPVWSSTSSLNAASAMAQRTGKAAWTWP